MAQNAEDFIYDLKKILLRAIIMSTSKLLIGPLTSIRGFHTHLMK